MRRKGISMVALVITIIVLIVLTSAVVITGVGVPKQAQLAVFYNNLDTVQELVTLKMSDNMITEALRGYGENYKWVDIVENYTAEKGRANEPVVFDEYQINGVWLERISPTMLQNNTSLAQGERSKYYVSSQGIVYYEGFVYEGETYYTKNAEPVENGQTLTSMLPTNGSFNEEKGVNSPKLLPGMTAVYWDANGVEVTSTNPGADTEFYNNWYDYIAQTSTTENGGTSKWANAKTADGSYWVWIPRYAYSITSGYHGEDLDYVGDIPEMYKTTEAGTIDVEFLRGKATTSNVVGRTFVNESGANNWNIHPAFTVEGIELAGIWVAKYEMSMETDGVSTETISYSIGDVGISASIKAVSKPGVSSWRCISIDNIFTNAYNYDRAKESHFIKNIEWGAVAYLTHSAYGRNGTELAINNSKNFITGNSGASPNALESTINTYAYNTPQGVLASTTGNIYGIYDMRGGALERVAGYVSNSEDMILYGKSLLNADNKYKDIYATTYELAEPIYGDAIYETSLNSYPDDIPASLDGRYSAGWYGDQAGFCCYDLDRMVLERGGDHTWKRYAGIFAFAASSCGPGSYQSWRVVLWGSLQ